MAIILKNNTGATSTIGKIVALDPNDNGAFVYLSANASKAIGVVTESVPYRKPCKIATQGEKARVLITGNVVKDNIIRSVKTGDPVSLGTGVIAKTGDAPYLQVGTTISSGRGLVSCILNLNYISVLNSSNAEDIIADGTYTMGFGMLTDGTVTIRNGVVISIQEAT